MGYSMKAVRIYIEPASLPLTQQLVDYIKKYEDNNIVNIIAFQRLNINVQFVNNENTAFIDNVNDGLLEKLRRIATFVRGLQASSIEIHTNIHREKDILFPLMRMLASFYPIANIKLKLYDDGSGSLIERAAIESLDSVNFERLMQQRKEQLLEVLNSHDDRKYTWNTVDNYIWHYFMDVQYFFIKPRKKALNKPFYKKIEPYVVYSDFNIQKQVSEKEKTLLLNLVNFPMDLYHHLAILQNDPQSLLFITSYCMDPDKKMLYHQRLIELIGKLKLSGKIPDSAKVVFKGHPENSALNPEICQAIGHNVTCIPDAIPIEFLSSFNLLPKRIGGEFSSTFFCLEGGDTEFVILKGKKYERHNQVFYDLSNKYKAFDLDKIIHI